MGLWTLNPVYIGPITNATAQAVSRIPELRMNVNSEIIMDVAVKQQISRVMRHHPSLVVLYLNLFSYVKVFEGEAYILLFIQ